LAAAWRQHSIGVGGSAAAAVCHQHGGGGQQRGGNVPPLQEHTEKGEPWSASAFLREVGLNESSTKEKEFISSEDPLEDTDHT
jgi:hypothetical protein